MRRIATAALTAAIVVAAPAAAAGEARLSGTFAMRGVVTRAVHVRGERRGQVVSRSWQFTPQCPQGPCQQVTLSRARGHGAVDTLVLSLNADGSYSGASSFFIPVLCRGERVPRGGEVRFTISVSITGTQTVQGTPFATAISATYTNPRRVNHTSCPGRLGHDGARYTGHLTTAPGAALR